MDDPVAMARAQVRDLVDHAVACLERGDARETVVDLLVDSLGAVLDGMEGTELVDVGATPRTAGLTLSEVAVRDEALHRRMAEDIKMGAALLRSMREVREDQERGLVVTAWPRGKIAEEPAAEPALGEAMALVERNASAEIRPLGAEELGELAGTLYPRAVEP